MGNTQPNSWSETNIKAQTIKHRWTVTNFSLCLKPTGDCIITEFSYDNQRTKWSLNIYPFGDCESSKEYVSLHLLLLSAETDCVVAQGKLAIITKYGDTCKTHSFESREFSLKNGYVLRLIKRSQLLQMKDQVLPNDTFTIFLKLKYQTSIENRASVVNEFCSTQARIDLCTRLMSLKESGEFYDIVIKVGSDKFYLHKVIAAASPVFHNWLQSNTTQSTVSLAGYIKSDIFEMVVDFIYGGKVPELKRSNLDIAKELLAATDKFKLDEMKSTLQQALTALINVDTVPTLLVMADQYQATRLKSNAIEFIKTNIPEVTKTKQWQVCMDGKPALLQELFEKVHK